jgi:urease beta subunit
MADPTAAEILEWALINRARLDPAGEAVRAGIPNVAEGGANIDGVALNTTSKQPLAWNDKLGAVADQHTAEMLAANKGLFHDPNAVIEQHLTTAQYQFQRWGENISESLPLSAGNLTTEMKAHELSLFNDTNVASRGHRENILDDRFQEVGVGASTGVMDGATRSIITEDFGKPSSGGQFLTGIAYNDADKDAFYSIGEGRSGITVTTTAGTVVSGSAGQFSKAISAGTQTVTFSGGDLAAPVSVSATVTAGRNALIDLVDRSTVETSVSLTALNGVTKIIGLGNNGLTLTGNALDNAIVSALGNDSINGGDGTDTVVYSGKSTAYTVTDNHNGTFTVKGAEGTDTLTSVEKIQFSDKTVTLSGPAPVAGNVSIGDVSITEGASGTKVATFVVTRSEGTAAFDVAFKTQDGTATTADKDYVASSGSVHFNAGETSKTISVTVNGDTKVEANETFNVLLSNPTNGATIKDGTGVGTIVNDDSAPAPVAGNVSIGDVSITEGASGTKVATFVVTRSEGTAAFDVAFKTQDGTATTADKDYVASSGSVHFNAGETSKTISVTVNGDTKVEANETFNVLLSNPTNGATIKDGTGVGTIVNDDSAPAPVAGNVSIGDVSITEGANGTKVANFVVTRSEGTAAFDVAFKTQDGTATTVDKDYVANSGSVHFNAGETSKTISVTVNGDTKVEANETFNVLLSNATNGAAIKDGTGVGTIVNDDSAPAPVAGSVVINDVTTTEGNNGTHVMTFTVTRSGGTAAFDVDFATKADTASAADGDYVARGNTLHFNAGETTKTIDVVVNGDTKVEANETFKLVLSNATNGAKLADDTGIGTIINDDAAAKHHAAGDFGGDGSSDILFQSTGGKVAMWQMDGNKVLSNTGVTSLVKGWSVEGTGDFNGDGKADVLTHSDTGAVGVWQMNGDKIASSQSVGSMGADWKVVGIDDFGGDGKSDVLWQNGNQLAMWQMDGNKVLSSKTFGTVGNGWQVEGTGDFNGDGKADILLQKGNQVAMWQMDGDHVGQVKTFATIGDGFHVGGVADFNGDGKADILWHNDTSGKVVEWQMNGTDILSNTGVGSTAKGWEFAGTGDYNHDGKADLLLQNDAGAIAVWQMDGNHVNAAQTIGSVSTDWHIV